MRNPMDFFGKTFIVQTVCKEDLKSYFTPKQLKKLDDADMSKIAEKIADAIMYCDYWDIVENACDWFKQK